MVDVVRPSEKCGIVIPFRREKGDIATAKDRELILSNVRQILGTRCWDGTVDGPLGELPRNPFFGSLFYKLRHQNLKPVLKYQARAYAIDALSRWEPRVRVSDVNIIDEPRKLIIRTTVTIVDTSGRGTGDVASVETTVLKAAA